MPKKYHLNLYWLLIDQWKNKGLLPDEVILNKKNLFENQILKSL